MSETSRPDRLNGRNGDIWRSWVSGETQESIAARYGISQPRVSKVIAEIKATIPQEDRADLVRREVDFLDRLRTEALELWDAMPIPAYSNGKPVVDDATGLPALDHSQRLAGLDRAVKLHERLSKLLGLDAAAKTEATLTVDPEGLEVVRRIREWKAAQDEPGTTSA